MIKISELIEKLQKLQEKHGDLPVMYEEEGYGGEAMHFVSGVKQDKIYSHYLEDVDGYQKELKTLFPSWEGNPDEFWEREFEPAECITIKSGGMLYST